MKSSFQFSGFRPPPSVLLADPVIGVPDDPHTIFLTPSYFNFPAFYFQLFNYVVASRQRFVAGAHRAGADTHRVCAEANMACAGANKACAEANKACAEANKACAGANKACAGANMACADANKAGLHGSLWCHFHN